jgi:carbonic anhydrase/acetyltransferase-like protein (isoleucine patch superfamily)
MVFITDGARIVRMAIVTNRSNVEGDRPSDEEELPLGTFLYNALSDEDEAFDSVEAVREIRERDRC